MTVTGFYPKGAYLKLSQLNRGLPTFFKVFLAEKNLHKVGNPFDNFSLGRCVHRLQAANQFDNFKCTL